MTSSEPARIPWVAVGLISAAALAFELLLTRIFSIVHWHHLVGMIVSLALLGYGASGTFLTLLGERVRRYFAPLFVANALLFTVGATGAVWVIAWVPLNPLELPWDRRQPFYLMAVYAAAAVPFLGAANCIGMALSVFARQGHRIYAVDLACAGLGVAVVTAALWLWHPAHVLWPLGASGLAAAFIGGLETGLGRGRLALVTAIASLVTAMLLWPLEVDHAPYKVLPQATATLGASVELERPGPMGVLTVVANERVPFRHAPGLSLTHRGPAADQRALFVDGEAAGTLTPLEDGRPPGFLNHLVSTLPYRLVDQPRVLLLGLAGNHGLLQALAHGARTLTAVDPNPAIADLLIGAYGAYTGDLFARPGPNKLVVTEPRSYAQSSGQSYDQSHDQSHDQGGRDSYDLVVMDLGNVGNVGGLQSQATSFRLTTEAFGAYLRRLSPGGLFAVSGSLQQPPRETLKLAATAREALLAAGHTEPAGHLAMVRNWQRFVMVVGARPLSAGIRQAVRRFSAGHGFDLVALPGMTRDEANQYHVLDGPRYHDGVGRLLAPGAGAFMEAYPFAIAPATDDRPFFYRFSRWDNAADLLRLPAGTGYAHMDWAYWMAVAALVQALVLALVLILLPLLVLRRSRAGAGLKLRTAAYFAGVGLAFLFVEIAFIQHLQLLLGHPVHAFAVVLVSFLVWAGLGSYLSRQPLGRRRGASLRLRLAVAVAVIAVLAVAYILWMPALVEAVLGEPFAVRLGVVMALIAPLALAMGMPFPLGLALVEERSADLLPWAWGINGCASVVSAIAATLLAMEIGFSGLVMLAAALYLPLPWIFRRSPARPPP
ncbi:MAG: spermidine synthase [Gammaproteobacteria bacterium]|nr:spermidine synthase [Gammaproteobacteria bacterium]